MQPRPGAQIVLGGPTYDELVEWRDRLLPRLEENPRLYGVDSDYKKPAQIRVAIDRAVPPTWACR